LASCATNVPSSRSGRGETTTSSPSATATRPSSAAIPAIGPRHLTLAPRDRRAGGDPLARGHGLVELVDAPEQRAELELPERLAQLRAVRRRKNELGRIGRDVEIALHRREHIRGARLIGELGQVLLPLRRQLLDVLQHALERPVLRDEARRSCPRCPGHPGCCRSVA
jgi:hypothetical protein